MIYLADISGCGEEDLQSVCTARKEYAAKYKTERDRVRSLGAAYLLGIALKTEGYTGRTDVEILHDEAQKPYLTDPALQDVCFSLSHAKDYVAVALAKVPVGIDIERIRPYQRPLTDRFFCEQEKAYILEREEEMDLAFTRIWTLKESFLKVTGTGLSGLNTCTVLPHEVLTGNEGTKDSGNALQMFSYRQTYDEHTYCGIIPAAPEGYALAICIRTDDGTDPEDVKINYVNLKG